MKGCCTVFTDASFCFETKAMGWAVWIKFGKKKRALRFHGRGISTNSHTAELHALKRGEILIRKYVPEAHQHIITFRCDCIGALQKFNPDFPGAEIRKCHVKGHTSKQGASSFVNRWCDKKAKERMLKKRALIKKGIERCS